MKVQKKIWNDIKRGENIDLIFTVMFAFGLVILNLVQVAPDEWIAPITLAVLGILAITNLVNRYKVEDLVEKISKSDKSFFLKEYPAEFKKEFSEAKELLIVGVTLNRTIRSNYVQLEKMILSGCFLKILVVHPTGSAINMAVSRHYARVNRDAELRGVDIETNLQLFCSLKQQAPNNVDIRTIEQPLAFGGFGINLNTATGVLYLEHYPYRTASDSIPKFILRSSDGPWFDFFKEEIDALWKSGVEWKCITQLNDDAT